MSASNKQIVVSGLKQMEADLEQQLAGVRAALAAFGGGTANKGKTAAIPRKRSGTGGGKPGVAPQAALDAAAVKRGVATPEQVARYEARVAAKAAAAPASEGASLAEAAAS